MAAPRGPVPATRILIRIVSPPIHYPRIMFFVSTGLQMAEAGNHLGAYRAWFGQLFRDCEILFAVGASRPRNSSGFFEVDLFTDLSVNTVISVNRTDLPLCAYPCLARMGDAKRRASAPPRSIRRRALRAASPLLNRRIVGR